MERMNLMSVSASIDIKLSEISNERFPAIKILRNLINYGWTFNDNEKVSYLPIGDMDSYNWQTGKIKEGDLFKAIIEKESNGEIVGVVLTWRESGIGGSCLIWNDKSISFNITINRKLVEGSDRTDFDWYLTKILPALNKDNLNVKSFSCQEL